MSSLLSASADAAETTKAFLEITTWRLHNSDEDQSKRVAEYLEAGLFPALIRAGGRPVGAFANLIGPDSPSLFSITQYSSLAAMQEALAKIAADPAHEKASQALVSGPGMPFVTTESTLLQSLSVMAEAVLPSDVATRPARIFELRIYQNQSRIAQQKKAGMFNNGEIAVFQRLSMRPVFIGESIVGPRQPNITYMLSFDSLAEREQRWQAFATDPEWKKLSAPSELKDSQIVANITNLILRPLPFSPLR